VVEGGFGLLEIVKECGVGMEERGAVLEIVVGYLVSAGTDGGKQIRMAQSAVSDDKKGGSRVVMLQDVEDLRSKDWVWAIVEGEGDERKFSADAIEDVGSETFEEGEDGERLGPEDEGRGRAEDTADQEKDEDKSHTSRSCGRRSSFKDTRFWRGAGVLRGNLRTALQKAEKGRFLTWPEFAGEFGMTSRGGSGERSRAQKGRHPGTL